MPKTRRQKNKCKINILKKLAHTNTKSTLFGDKKFQSARDKIVGKPHCSVCSRK